MHNVLHVLQHEILALNQLELECLAVHAKDADYAVQLHPLQLRAPLPQLIHLLFDVAGASDVIQRSKLVLAEGVSIVINGKVLLKYHGVVARASIVSLYYPQDAGAALLELAAVVHHVAQVGSGDPLPLLKSRPEGLQQPRDGMHARHHGCQHRRQRPAEIRLLWRGGDGGARVAALHAHSHVEEAVLLGRRFETLQQRAALRVDQELQVLNHHIVGKADELRQHRHLLLREGQRAGALQRLLLHLLHRLAFLALVRVRGGGGGGGRRALAARGEDVLGRVDTGRHILAHLVEEGADLVHDGLEALAALGACVGLLFYELVDVAGVVGIVLEEGRGAEFEALAVHLEQS